MFSVSWIVGIPRLYEHNLKVETDKRRPTGEEVPLKDGIAIRTHLDPTDSRTTEYGTTTAENQDGNMDIEIASPDSEPRISGPNTPGREDAEAAVTPSPRREVPELVRNAFR